MGEVNWPESELGPGAPSVPEPSRLEAWRAREELTQEQAAEIAGVTRRAWQRWETGERSVPQWLADVLRQRWGSGPE
jgi:DNA-binding XRE family transcriptional regulator